MWALEVFRFGHRDWYNQTYLSDENNNSVDSKTVQKTAEKPAEYTKPSVIFEDEYFSTPLIQRVAWGCMLKLIAIHLLAFASIFYLHQLSLKTLAFQLIYIIISGISVTAGAHRLWTHRSYRARTPFRTFLMLANTIAAQNDLYEWCRDHRVHHKYSDTNADPHNIERGLFFSHVGWLVIKKHPDVYKYGSRIDCTDLIADPVVRFNMKYYCMLVPIFSFALPTIIPHLLFGEPVMALFLAAFMRLAISLHFTWAVNSYAHYAGTKPFNKSMRPTEAPIVSFLAVGEGWHNYHHTFPHDYSCSELGWHINLTTLVIDAMAWLGQVSNRKTISKEAILRQKLRNGDGNRLPREIQNLPEREKIQLFESLLHGQSKNDRTSA